MIILSNKKPVRQFFVNYFPLLFGVLFYVFITGIFSNIPFFWDGGFFSETAVHFFNNGYKSLLVPIDSDTGGFPLFGIYMSLWWKLLGKTLLVSHIALLPFLIGICFEFFKLAKVFLKEIFVFAAILLLLIEPTIITQSIIMSYDIILLYFSLLAINSLLKNSRWLFLVSLLLIAACSSRGVITIAIVFISNVFFRVIYKQQKELLKDMLCYFPMILFVIFWSYYHYLKTGWFFFSPLRENSHEALSGISMMLRQFAYALWKMADFGRIFLFGFVIFGFVAFFRKMRQDKQFLLISSLLFVSVIISAVFIMLFSNPVSHRYFLLVYILLIITAMYVVQNLKSRLLRITTSIFFVLVLFSGNYWYYPQKYGNGWDSSMKVIPFFKIDNEMKNFIEQSQINAYEVYTSFPLHKNYRYTYLLEYDYCYSDIDKTDIRNCKYYLESNICNGFNFQIDSVLKNNYVKLKEIKTNQLFLTLYKNSQN